MANIIEIASLGDANLNIYTKLNEAQLFHYYEPQPGIFIAESPKVIERALRSGYEPLSFLVATEDIKRDASAFIEQYPDIPIYTAPYDVLTGLTGFALTRGILCAMKRKLLSSIESLCKDAKRIVILSQVTNPTNVGAIFRNAAALGIDAVLLTKGCSDPLYRRAARVSMGTVFQIPWTYFDEEILTLEGPGLKALRDIGFKTAAMALCEDSVSIDDANLMQEDKLAILLGNEGDGLAAETIASCDYTVLIPMSHDVDSLNVAAASAVAFWQLGKH